MLTVMELLLRACRLVKQQAAQSDLMGQSILACSCCSFVASHASFMLAS